MTCKQYESMKRFLEYADMVTIPNTDMNTITGHSMRAVKIVYDISNNGIMAGVDKHGKLIWFHASVVSKVKYEDYMPASLRAIAEARG